MLCSNSTKVQVAANIYFTFLYLFILVLVTEHSWVSSRWRLTRPPISVVLNPPTQHHTLRIEALLRTCNTPQCQEMALSLLVDISTKPHLWHLISKKKKKIISNFISNFVRFSHFYSCPSGVCFFFRCVILKEWTEKNTSNWIMFCWGNGCSFFKNYPWDTVLLF